MTNFFLSFAPWSDVIYVKRAFTLFHVYEPKTVMCLMNRGKKGLISIGYNDYWSELISETPTYFSIGMIDWWHCVKCNISLSWAYQCRHFTALFSLFGKKKQWRDWLFQWLLKNSPDDLKYFLFLTCSGSVCVSHNLVFFFALKDVFFLKLYSLWFKM